MDSATTARWHAILDRLQPAERGQASFIYVEAGEDLRVPGLLLSEMGVAFSFRVAESRLGLLGSGGS